MVVVDDVDSLVLFVAERKVALQICSKICFVLLYCGKTNYNVVGLQCFTVIARCLIFVLLFAALADYFNKTTLR